MRVIAVAAGIGATAWLLAAGVTTPATARLISNGCAATAVHYQPTKNPGLSELPWVRARPERTFVMGLLVSYPQTLRDARVNRSGGLVLWARGERIVWKVVDSTVKPTIVARRVGSGQSFRISLRVSRSGLVSTLRFPTAGCWHLTLRTGRGAASVVALVVPRPARPLCDPTPVDATSMAVATPHGAGIAGAWSWFTFDHTALIYTHGVAPRNLNTKVPWWIRRGWGARLRLTGVRVDGQGHFNQAFWQAGAPSSRPDGYEAVFPSTVKVPSAGCWLLTLRTGRVAGILVVRAIDR